MNALKLITTGLAGSSSVTGLHQALRNIKGTPRVDLLGEQAIIKIFGDKLKKKKKQPYYASLAGDLAINSLYYSIIAKAKNPVLTGLIMGIVAGIVAILTPNFMGLSKKYVKSTDKKKYMTIGYYTFAGIVAGLTATTIKNKYFVLYFQKNQQLKMMMRYHCAIVFFLKDVLDWL